MKTLLMALGFGLAGAMAAFLPSGQNAHDGRGAKAAVDAATVLPGPGRMAIGPAELRQAYASGLIDRPIKTILDVPERMTYGEYRWNDQGVPAGPTWIRIDLRSQLISVFRAGHEIGTAVVLYGTDGLPTPTGKFPILAKLKDHRSSTYDAPMPYTLRLTGDGVSIHGSNVRYGFATHGCVGVPTAFAAKLFSAVKKGDEVLIVSGKPRPRSA
jgi:lipoprotein-anchoring transpeptidase ErfK/SrfK